MSPALVAYQTAHLLRPARPGNRKRRTAARASLRRIAAASAIAAAALAAAIGWTAGAAASAERAERATAAAASYIMHGTRTTLAEIDAAPADVRAAVWEKWTSRAVAAASAPSRDRNPEASARVMDFARGYSDTVSEEDLMNASLSAVRAAVESGRLD